MPTKDEMLSKAISSDSRRAILRLLSINPHTVTGIATSLGISLSLASKHLTLLDYLGIIKAESRFPEKYYSVKLKGIKDLLKIYDNLLEELKNG